MKKIFVVLAMVALCASCAKTDKCKCSYQINLGSAELSDKNVVVSRPEEKKCSDIKVEDIKGELGSLNLSKVAKINCVPYNE